jgi:hypothetical protein
VYGLGVDPISETSFMSAIPHPVGKVRCNVVRLVIAVTRLYLAMLGWALSGVRGKLY